MSISIGMPLRLGRGRVRPSATQPPSAVGPIPDVLLAEGSGIRTRAMAPYFSGGGTYSIVGAPFGVTINSSTGVLSANTDTTGKMAAWYTFGDWDTEGQHPGQDHTEEHFGVIRLPNGDGVEKPAAALLREYGAT